MGLPVALVAPVAVILLLGAFIGCDILIDALGESKKRDEPNPFFLHLLDCLLAEGKISNENYYRFLIELHTCETSMEFIRMLEGQISNDDYYRFLIEHPLPEIDTGRRFSQMAESDSSRKFRLVVSIVCLLLLIAAVVVGWLNAAVWMLAVLGGSFVINVLVLGDPLRYQFPQDINIFERRAAEEQIKKTSWPSFISSALLGQVGVAMWWLVQNPT